MTFVEEVLSNVSYCGAHIKAMLKIVAIVLLLFYAFVGIAFANQFLDPDARIIHTQN